MRFEELLQKTVNELGLFRAKLESLTAKRYDVRFEEDNSEGKFIAIFTQIEEEKKTLSDKILSQYGHENDLLLARDVKQALKEFIDWFSTLYKPGLSQPEFETKAKEIFGDKLC